MTIEDGEICPTCNQVKNRPNIGQDVYEILEKTDFFKNLGKEIVAKVQPVEGKDHFVKIDSDVIAKAMKEMPAPQVKLIHHGIEDLKKCDTCKVDLDKEILAREAEDFPKMLKQREIELSNRLRDQSFSRLPQIEKKEVATLF